MGNGNSKGEATEPNKTKEPKKQKQKKSKGKVSNLMTEPEDGDPWIKDNLRAKRPSALVPDTEAPAPVQSVSPIIQRPAPRKLNFDHY